MKAKIVDLNKEEELYLRGRIVLFCYIPIGTTFLYEGQIMSKYSQFVAISVITPEGEDRVKRFDFIEPAIVFVFEDEYRKIKEKDNGRKTVFSNR